MYSFAEDGADGADNKYFRIDQNLLYNRYEGDDISEFYKRRV